ncbi:2',3'-cyclic-nucleotide 3'-phosphodiesterase-like [Saccostrea echinata]|uniref:2',3'-cyclic-nucleotide 3'-phosphodiesterase-like n=1 Tax=Saccostrea echinata TaxID=191078 RepID=UPI002A7FAC48|nr:2',3'-cyclic-nucleotide 3'-phosphodiesterase-like [Saccostrea echinata]
MGNIFSTCCRGNVEKYREISNESKICDDNEEVDEVDRTNTGTGYTHLDEERIEPVVNSLVSAIAEVRITPEEPTDFTNTTQQNERIEIVQDEERTETVKPVVNSIVTPATDAKTFLEEPVLDFPFLKNEKTISFIRKSNTIFIMRGVPGSGKSTIARALKRVYPYAVLCSADDYFMKGSEYIYRSDDLGSAHRFCQEKATEAVRNGANVIIIDNTNIKRWEMKFYLDLARQQKYHIVLVQPKTDWKDNPRLLASKNSHNVDEETIRQKIKGFEEYVPFYYAWFLNREDSMLVHQKCYRTLTYCVENISGFCSFILGEDYSSSEFLEYFKLREIPDTTYHCTAKFLGGPKSNIRGRLEYHNSNNVQEAYGKSFTIVMTGMIVTSSVVAIRIKLPSEEALMLFDKPEENADGSFPNRFCHQKGSSAHLTMATAEGVPAKHSNADLLAVCEMEKTGSKSKPPINLGFGVVHFLDRGYCSILFDQHLELFSLFTGS